MTTDTTPTTTGSTISEKAHRLAADLRDVADLLDSHPEAECLYRDGGIALNTYSHNAEHYTSAARSAHALAAAADLPIVTRINRIGQSVYHVTEVQLTPRLSMRVDLQIVHTPSRPTLDSIPEDVRGDVTLDGDS